MNNDSNLARFDADLEAFAKKVDLNISLVIRRVTLDLWTRITERTPVDTGRARASWDIKTGVPSGYVPPPALKDQVGGFAGGVGDVFAAVADLDGTQVVYLTSALDYVQYLEEGSSKQAPTGMVELSLAEVETEIAAMIADI